MINAKLILLSVAGLLASVACYSAYSGSMKCDASKGCSQSMSSCSQATCEMTKADCSGNCCDACTDEACCGRCDCCAGATTEAATVATTTETEPLATRCCTK